MHNKRANKTPQTTTGMCSVCKSFTFAHLLCRRLHFTGMKMLILLTSLNSIAHNYKVEICFLNALHCAKEIGVIMTKTNYDAEKECQ